MVKRKSKMGSSHPDAAPIPADRPLAAREPSHLLASLSIGIPSLLYTFLLVWRLDPRIWAGGGDFRDYLKPPEAAAFVLILGLDIVFLSMTATRVLEWLSRKFAPRIAGYLPFLVWGAYIAGITIKFQVMRSIKANLTLTLLKRLGGGSWLVVLSFVRGELTWAVPLLAVSIAVAIAGRWFHKKYGRNAELWLDSCRAGKFFLSGKSLAIANAALVVLAPLVVFVSAPLHRILSDYFPHLAYSTPAIYLTDFDADGYGLLDSPPDCAPFDSRRHPYAVEIPGNGIDEDCVAGDLPAVIWNQKPMGPWDASRMARRNVLLIVLESARAELQYAQLDGQPAMPALQNPDGQFLKVLSHSGVTPPSLTGMFTGGVYDETSGLSLVDRFKGMGYQTAVLSAQNENFGDIAKNARMAHADLFFDAWRFPSEQQLYNSFDAAVMAMSHRLVTGKFAEWLDSLDRDRGFFAYINVQEMHYPYLYTEMHGTRKMVPENREWIRKTYFSAARKADEAIASIFTALDERGLRQNTVAVIIGDHGEELFDHGSLGHGVSVTLEGYSPVCKLVNSKWKAPSDYIGISQVSTIIYNSLLRSPEEALPLNPEVLLYSISARKPAQIALATPGNGILRYDFSQGAWARQACYGCPMTPAKPDNHVIYMWESYLATYPSPAP